MAAGVRQTQLLPDTFDIECHIVECIDLEAFGEHLHGDVVGDGPLRLTIARIGQNHIIPLIRVWGWGAAAVYWASSRG